MIQFKQWEDYGGDNFEKLANKKVDNTRTYFYNTNDADFKIYQKPEFSTIVDHWNKGTYLVEADILAAGQVKFRLSLGQTPLAVLGQLLVTQHLVEKNL